MQKLNRRGSLLVVLTAVSLLLMACDSTTTSTATPDAAPGIAGEVRSIEEISAAGPPQIVDITDVDAVLLFQSDIPLACSVVYGETTEYGQIAVDQDMGGGAHTDHQPILTGLEPDTEYHYRVQGVAADGTLYAGEDATFRTLPAPAETEVNLASLEAGAKVVAVSSNFGGAPNDEPWGADSAIDGNRGTAWSSDGDGDDAFLEIELARPAQVHAVEVWTRSMSDGTAQILAFTLTTGEGDVLGPFEVADAGEPHRFELQDVVARSLRLDVIDSSGGNTGLVEFAVYGTPVAEETVAPSSVDSTGEGQGNADVVHVRAVQDAGGSWTFHVTVEHPDTGWDDYADGWDVVTPDGAVLKPDPDSAFTRLLLHPHVDEQPFTRSQAGIIIPPGVEQVSVRAHDLSDGYGGREVTVNLDASSGRGFEVERTP